MDYGIAGIDPEPRAGYRSRARRDQELEQFSNAVWQRHEHAKAVARPAYWPTPAAFRSNWPKLAFDLIVADWRFSGAHAATDSSEIDVELLDPKPKPKRHWREQYAFELFRSEQFELDLIRQPEQAPGDNLELVYERAELTANERLVVRAFLAAQELDDLARDLDWKLNTVQIVLRNALDRIRFVALNPNSAERFVVGKGEQNAKSRSRDSSRVLQRAHAASSRTEWFDRVG